MGITHLYCSKLVFVKLKQVGRYVLFVFLSVMDWVLLVI